MKGRHSQFSVRGTSVRFLFFEAENLVLELCQELERVREGKGRQHQSRDDSRGGRRAIRAFQIRNYFRGREEILRCRESEGEGLSPTMRRTSGKAPLMATSLR